MFQHHPGRAHWRTFFAAALLALTGHTSSGQTIIEFGTGSGTNDVNTYPSPYGNLASGAKHQLIFHATELVSAGFEAGGTISACGFNVADTSGAVFSGFTISMGLTMQDEFDPPPPTPPYIAGTAPVWGPDDYHDTLGWNMHTLDVPFSWDGVSNLVVQTCFSNTSNGQNALMYNTQTPFNSTIYRGTNNPNVCTGTGNQQVTDVRPDMRFIYYPPMIPPSAAFSASSTFSCSPEIQFTDLSEYHPTGWFWDFGDGTTDTVQNPLHSFIGDGTFTVMLVDTNAYGADTATMEVTINAFGPQPAPACIPNSLGTVAGLGITQVNFGDVIYPSADAVTEGYADRGCVVDTVLVCGNLDIEVFANGTAFTHNIRAWVDWNASATFEPTELVLSADNVLEASATVPVPAGAVLDTPLRLRVMADYSITPTPEPCNDLVYGQAEDYALVVQANPLAPVAAFSATPTYTCDGVVQFDDASVNCATSWEWDFGDGGSSTDPDPVHAYLADGTYTVTLIVTNGAGADTLIIADMINVDLSGQLVPAACIPQTQSYCCGYGILQFQFGGIVSISPDGVEGYVDRSCGNTAAVEEGDLEFWQVSTGGVNPHDVFMWIDLDNDGAFSGAELVHQELSEISPSAYVEVPMGVVYDTPLRLRIAADVIGELTGPCDPPLYGQAEDLSVMIAPNDDPPVADFSASPISTCDGVVNFIDLSQELPTTWFWDFGDGQTSTDQDPIHTYPGPGTYTVSLTVTNVNGSDTETVPAMIQVIESTFCDTTAVPDIGDLTLTECYGVLTDDGGALEDYSPGESGGVTISPAGAQWVTLDFSQFAFETNFDYLRIFDGPNIFSPLIGDFTGNGVGVLPGGGVISSTGPSITVQQAASPGPTTWEGFIANWNCSFTGIPETDVNGFVNAWPQPSDGPITIALARPASASDRLLLQDPLGKLVTELPLGAGARVFTFDLSGQAAGCYSLALLNAAGRWTRTIVLN